MEGRHCTTNSTPALSASISPELSFTQSEFDDMDQDIAGALRGICREHLQENEAIRSIVYER